MKRLLKHYAYSCLLAHTRTVCTFLPTAQTDRICMDFSSEKRGKILISYKRSLHRSEHRFHYILLQSTHARKAQERNKSYMARNEQATKLLLCWATLVKAINIQFLTGSQSISTPTRRSSITQ